MKTISTLSSFLLKSFVVFGLVVAAGVIGVGIAAGFAFHELGGRLDLSRSSQGPVQAEPEMTPRLVSVSRLNMWRGEKIVMNVDASLAANRFVAADASDRPRFTYADYQTDSANAPARPLATSSMLVPPPLNRQPDDVAPAKNPPPAILTDPGSRYIVDARTGRVIGIDGTLGAMAEAQRQQQLATAAPPKQREVRAALPVDAVIPSDLPPPKPDMYPAIRRALPVESDADPVVAQPFNAANELVDDNRPVLRAQPVTISQAAKTQRRLFSLP